MSAASDPFQTAVSNEASHCRRRSNRFGVRKKENRELSRRCDRYGVQHRVENRRHGTRPTRAHSSHVVTQFSFTISDSLGIGAARFLFSPLLFFLCVLRTECPVCSKGGEELAAISVVLGRRCREHPYRHVKSLNARGRKVARSLTAETGTNV